MCLNVSSVGVADWEAMTLMGHRRVGLTARPRKRDFPHTHWMNVLPLASSLGEVEFVLL